MGQAVPQARQSLLESVKFNADDPRQFCWQVWTWAHDGYTFIVDIGFPPCYVTEDGNGADTVDLPLNWEPAYGR